MHSFSVLYRLVRLLVCCVLFSPGARHKVSIKLYKYNNLAQFGYKQQLTTQIKLDILGFPKYLKRVFFFHKGNHATETLNDLETKSVSRRSTQESTLNLNFQSYRWTIAVCGNGVASRIDYIPMYSTPEVQATTRPSIQITLPGLSDSTSENPVDIPCVLLHACFRIFHRYIVEHNVWQHTRRSMFRTDTAVYINRCRWCTSFGSCDTLDDSSQMNTSVICTWDCCRLGCSGWKLGRCFLWCIHRKCCCTVETSSFANLWSVACLLSHSQSIGLSLWSSNTGEPLWL